MDWSPQQQAALQQVEAWLNSGDHSGDKQVFRLFGYAGTGKTTLAKEFALALAASKVFFAAYTGKAAYVMQQKGCPGATTLHKLIYKPKDKSRERLQELKEDLEQLEASLKTEGWEEKNFSANVEWAKLHLALQGEIASHKRLSFGINEDSELSHGTLVVIDECSMVDAKMGEDLLSFKIPTLVLGDPAQLPPVFGGGYFTNQQPHCLLTEIHRQAAGNPILELAHKVRRGDKLQHGTYGNSRVIGWDQVKAEEVMAADQVLVGTNKLRGSSNRRLRELLGFKHLLPMPGDKVVCLRNNHDLGLLNGSLWTVKDSQDIGQQALLVNLESPETGREVNTTVHNAYFLGDEPAFWNIKDNDCFDYGYALTVHKSQGSQWDKVYIFDEGHVFRDDANKWRYTAITRAAKEVVVVTR